MRMVTLFLVILLLSSSTRANAVGVGIDVQLQLSEAASQFVMAMPILIQHLQKSMKSFQPHFFKAVAENALEHLAQMTSVPDSPIEKHAVFNIFVMILDQEVSKLLNSH